MISSFGGCTIAWSFVRIAMNSIICPPIHYTLHNTTRIRISAPDIFIMINLVKVSRDGGGIEGALFTTTTSTENVLLYRWQKEQ